MYRIILENKIKCNNCFKNSNLLLCVAEISGSMCTTLQMTEATSRGKAGPRGREDFHFTYFEKERKSNDRMMDDFFLSYYLLFIYFWLCWVFVSVRGLSPVVASRGHSLSWPPLLRSTGSRRTGSIAVAHGPSCSVACGIFPDQGSNPCPLHWQADSQPLRHQGSPDG